MPVNLNTDVANSVGNVTISKYKNGVLVNEITKHNNITSEGINCMLQSLARNYNCYIRGIQVDTKKSVNGDLIDKHYKFYSFSSVNVFGSYVEFRFYLGTNGSDLSEINDSTVVGFRLLSQDSTGTEIEFATVSISDKIDGTQDPVMLPIEKDSDTAVLVVWRIAITSIFTQVIS